jgi:transposase
MQITTIGLDIAKNVFQVHGIDAAEKVVFGSNFGAAKCWRSSRRRRVALWAGGLRDVPLLGRELTKLGHQVRLMPAKDVKAYVKRAAISSAYFGGGVRWRRR